MAFDKKVGFAFFFHANKKMTVRFDILFNPQQYTSARLLKGWYKMSNANYEESLKLVCHPHVSRDRVGVGHDAKILTR